VTDRDMGGRIIACLRSKYANSNVELDAKCVIELVDVIQTSKLDVQLDVKLYQKCKKILLSSCAGMDQEDCLKLMYQKNKIGDKDCIEQVIRIIKEGRADIHVDHVLASACQTDLLKFCNDIPIGTKEFLCKKLYVMLSLCRKWETIAMFVK
jgi:Golgi apparatus protein 1